MEEEKTLTEQGQESYQQWRDNLWANPEYRAIYEEEAAKSELWLQLVEARQAAGLTQEQMAERMGVSQAQVARIEKRGYDAYTLKTLRRYVAALGDRFRLEVSVKQVAETAPEPAPAAVR
ncbi:MAG: XRE family transcriptional regulator [Chloroflexi bacterium]|nr:XRE family transcriptional regulator [Chloroflexota bacterium]